MLTAPLALAIALTGSRLCIHQDEQGLVGSSHSAALTFMGNIATNKPPAVSEMKVERTLDLIELCPSFTDLCRARDNYLDRRLIERRIDLVMRLLQSTDTKSLRGALATIWARATPRTAEQRAILRQYAKIVPKQQGEEEHRYNSRLLSWAQVVPNVEKFIFVNRILFEPDIFERANVDYDFLPIRDSVPPSHTNRLYPVTSVTKTGISFAKEIRVWEGAHPYDARSEFDYYARKYKRRSKWW